MTTVTQSQHRFNLATLTAHDGTTWSTDINGTEASVRAYFLGKWFDMGHGDQERMVQVVQVVFTPASQR